MQPSATATATAAQPTGAPTITAGPTATAFPLKAGWWDNAVCYQVFVRSFYDSNGDGVGDLNGLIQKLDYINDGDANSRKDLGANCIWLMPIMESPSYHGYDTADYYNVDREYGSNDDFKRLIAEAHKRGIKVILDLVLNHTSNQNPWFQAALNDPNSPYRNWYIFSKTDPGYKGPYGEQVWFKSPVRDEYYYAIFSDSQPDLNYRNPAVTQEADKISAFWLNEMGADGFRLDAIKYFIENGLAQEDTPETRAWLRQYRQFLAQTRPDAFTVGEVFGGNLVTLAPYYPDQLDTYFEFDIGAALIQSANANRAGFYLGAVNSALKLPYQRWAPFLTNHDQTRAMSLMGNDAGKARIAATALLTSPGLPFVYYGEEIGMLGAKGDPPKVDEPIRSPLQWTGDATGGFTTGTPWQLLQPNAKDDNIAAQDADPNSLLNLYRRLIHLQTENSALARGSFTQIKTSDSKVGAFLRQTDNETVLVVLNFSKDPADNLSLSLEQSALQAGTYRAQPLLGDQPGAALNVGAGGAITGYVPLALLAPRTGYIFALRK